MNKMINRLTKIKDLLESSQNKRPDGEFRIEFDKLMILGIRDKVGKDLKHKRKLSISLYWEAFEELYDWIEELHKNVKWKDTRIIETDQSIRVDHDPSAIKWSFFHYELSRVIFENGSKEESDQFIGAQLAFLVNKTVVVIPNTLTGYIRDKYPTRDAEKIRNAYNEADRNLINNQFPKKHLPQLLENYKDNPEVRAEIKPYIPTP